MSSTRLSSHERRAGIINAAIRLFSEKGFKGATTKELASIVGVSEPVLYQHFSTKREIYTAILEELAATTGSEITHLLDPPPVSAGQDREFLTALGNGIIDWHLANPAYVRLLMLSALEGHEFNELFYQRYASAFFCQVKTYFASRIDDGVFRPADPALPAQTFIWLMAHYALELTIFHKPDLPRDQTVEGMIDIFLKGIQA